MSRTFLRLWAFENVVRNHLSSGSVKIFQLSVGPVWTAAYKWCSIWFQRPEKKERKKKKPLEKMTFWLRWYLLGHIWVFLTESSLICWSGALSSTQCQRGKTSARHLREETAGAHHSGENCEVHFKFRETSKKKRDTTVRTKHLRLHRPYVGFRPYKVDCLRREVGDRCLKSSIKTISQTVISQWDKAKMEDRTILEEVW